MKIDLNFSDTNKRTLSYESLKNNRSLFLRKKSVVPLNASYLLKLTVKCYPLVNICQFGVVFVGLIKFKF